jgi:hypothetical protein
MAYKLFFPSYSVTRMQGLAAGRTQRSEIRCRRSWVKLISDLRLLTSAMDGFNDLNDFNAFNDFRKLNGCNDLPNRLFNKLTPSA